MLILNSFFLFANMLRKMKRLLNIFFVLVIISPNNLLFSQCIDCVSVSQETQVLNKGNKSIFKCDIFYNREKDAITAHHYYPIEFVKMSNRYGEMKMYFPITNTVTLQQNQSLSTTNELLYYFINNSLSDLGLSKEGFSLISTTREEGMMVTTWQAPPQLQFVNQVRIVFKEMQPIYSEYINMKGDIIKKIYYSKYADFKTFSLPLRITEISFESKEDSTIKLSVFTNVQTSDFTENNYFNFIIPDDAKIAK